MLIQVQILEARRNKMAFRRIEMLLIMTFLLLNIFLAYVFVGKNALLFSEPLDQSRVNIQQEMRADDIQFEAPEDTNREEAFIRGMRNDVSEETLENKADGHYEFELANSGRILGDLADPIRLPGLAGISDVKAVDEEMMQPLTDFLTKFIYQGDQYEYVGFDSKQRMITFMQRTENDLFVVDGSGEIAFYLNENLEVERFDQTYIADVKTQGNLRKVVSEKQALENLYLNNKIQKGDRIVSNMLGYYQTLIVDDMTVYNPTWTFIIANSDGSFERLHVDGINGTIVQTDSN